MKKILLLVIVLLLLGGGGFGAYTYITGDSFLDKDMTELAFSEQSKSVEQLHLVEIRSFKVPVLHNAVAVKFLVFHIVLSVKDVRSQKVVNGRMNHLVDMYIRYLVAHFEVNAISDVLNRTELIRIIKQATYEVLSNKLMLRDVIIQGVYQKSTKT